MGFISKLTKDSLRIVECFKLFRISKTQPLYGESANRRLVGFGCFEGLHCFSNISVILRLGSRRYAISSIVAEKPEPLAPQLAQAKSIRPTELESSMC